MRYGLNSLITEGTVGVRNIAYLTNKNLPVVLYTEKSVHKVHLKLSVASRMPPKVAYPLH